ncbi:hypothetical protein PIB30_040644 [Stylosanthes scabra]|uniref:Uncharacterized protein n=1 Tax=Stylosanthes scabra TaxID=79078 RepID=A0ABU6WEN6_9FABA|nr:hypothetical protein [Stylosanthes scabra]
MKVMIKREKEEEEIIKNWTQIEEELKSAADFFIDDFEKFSSQNIPSFSSGISQDFKSLTPTPKRSKQEEIIDIPPINEMVPANISFQEVENPTTMGPMRVLTADEERKVYN